MKNATAKKKKAAVKKKAAPAKKAAATSPAKTPLVKKQPQSKLQAAVQAGMFLHTDDQWSLAYFNANDLHNEERELFA